MKILSFHARLTTLLLASLILLSACSGRDEPPAAPEYENPILFYLKTPSPRVIADKVLDLTGRTENGAQTGMMLTFLLSGYGFPAFQDFDPEMPVGLFYLGSDSLESENAILVMKGRPDSKLIAEVAPQFDLTIEVYNDWLLLARSPEILTQIVSRDELLELTAQSPAYDFEVTFLSQGLIAVKDQIIAEALSDLDEEDELEQAWSAAALNVFFQELAATDRFVSGLSIGDQEVSIGFDIHSFAGTQLGQLIAAATAGRPDLGRHLRDGPSTNHVNDVPVRALQAYLNHLADSLAAEIPEAWQPGFRSIQTLANRNFDSWNGMSATTLSFRGELPQSIQLLGGNYRIEHLRNLYDAINALWVEHGPNPERPLISLFENVGEIDGLPYHRLEVTAETNPADDSDDDVATTSLYIAMTSQGMIQADSLASLDRFLSDLKAPLPLEESILPQYQARPQYWLQGRVYLDRFIMEIEDQSGPSDPAATGTRANLINAIRALQGESLEPLTFEMSAEGYRLSSRASLPIATLEAILKKL